MNFARDHGCVLAVRGGGHNIAGNAVCDGGIILDLSRMRSVHVDLAARRARVEGGALLGDVDKETQAFGLAIPVGESTPRQASQVSRWAAASAGPAASSASASTT